MLKKDEVLEKMKTCFPRWMDIRKRNKSVGSHLLESISDSVCNVQEAIDDYVSSFFIDSYKDPDSIICFIYKGSIGNINLDSFSINNLSLAKTIGQFYDNVNVYYYEDGYVYVKPENVQFRDVPSIDCIYNNNNYVIHVEKVHVWNVFDEFAVFVGVERRTGETNGELYERIVNRRKAPLNASEDGLKNAIVTELCAVCPIDKNNIKVENGTPENLREYYKNFNSVLDYLESLNKDTIRSKTWDNDVWGYDFTHIDYLPHAWDVAINSYVNGTGQGNDLKAEIFPNNEATNVSVSLYKKSYDKVSEYVRNNNITMPVKMTLKKYNDVLNPTDVGYEINASEALDITDNNIMIKCSKVESGNEPKPIERLVRNSFTDLYDISISDSCKTIDKTGRYKIKFFRNRENYRTPIPMRISQCDIVETDASGVVLSRKSMLKVEDGFIVNCNGEIVDTGSKIYATKKKDFNTTENTIDSENGIEIDDLTRSSKLTIPINNLNGCGIDVETTADMIPLDTQAVKITNCTIVDNKIQTKEYDENDKNWSGSEVEISLEANTVRMDIEGYPTIKIFENGELVETTGEYSMTRLMRVNTKSFTTDIHDNPVQYDIIIKGMSPFSICNIQYNKYNVHVYTSKGELVKLSDETKCLPDFAENQLIIDMQTHTSISPVIKSVYIGDLMGRSTYETDFIEPTSNNRYADIDTNCKVELVKYDDSGDEINTDGRFDGVRVYTATSDNAYINIDLSEYTKINKISQPYYMSPNSTENAYFGEVVSVKNQGKDEYYIKLKSGQIVTTIDIDGEKLIDTAQLSLNNLIGLSDGDKLYVSNLIKDFIIENSGISREITLDRNEIATSYDYIKIDNLPETLDCVFISDDMTTTTISKTYDKIFSSLYFKLKSGEIYTAINSYKMFKDNEDNINVVDLFYPFIPSNTPHVAYKVCSQKDCYDVNFYTGDENVKVKSPWVIDAHKICIDANDKYDQKANYSSDEFQISRQMNIKDIIELDRYYSPSSTESIDLSKYMIVPEDGYKIHYSFVSLDDEQSMLLHAVEDIVTTNSSGFNKLQYSNIDMVASIFTDSEDRISKSDYEVYYDEGIIRWLNNDFLKNPRTIIIAYFIKIPDYIEPSMDKLYECVDSIEEAYEKIYSKTYTGMHEGDKINLNEINEYAENKDLISVNAYSSSPLYGAAKYGDAVTIVKKKSGNLVGIQSGFYYIDGKEYYMFSDGSTQKIEATDKITFNNVRQENTELILNRLSTNYVSNSVMDCSKKDIIHVDSMDVEGTSNFKYLTACDNYNCYNRCLADISIVKGVNGKGVHISCKDKGYVYIEITDSLSDSSVVSFYLSGIGKAYLFREKDINIVENGKTLEYRFTSDYAEMVQEIMQTSGIYECEIQKISNTRYYILFTGDCLVDDIVICDRNKYSPELHRKMIDVLGLNVMEKVGDDYEKKVYVNFNDDGFIFNHAEHDSNIIRTGSDMQWGLTCIQSVKGEQLKKCVQYGTYYDSGMLCAADDGMVETEPVYLKGQPDKIKRVFIKVNSMCFSSETPNVTVETQNDGGDYSFVKSSTTNGIYYVPADKLQKYIRVRVDVMKDQIIDSVEVYAEYKSNSGEGLPVIQYNNASCISKIYDLEFEGNYRLAQFKVNSISSINDINMYIRKSRDTENEGVWSDWQQIQLCGISSDGYLNIGSCTLNDCSLVQLKIDILNKNARFSPDYMFFKKVQ